MTPEILTDFQNAIYALTVCIGVLCGIELGKAFSFWKW